MRVLIIGLGSIAKKHIKALKELDDGIEVYALRSSSDSIPNDNTTDIYSYDEIPTIKPDFIIISNPTAKHYYSLSRLAESGIPLFIEKPVLSDLSEAESLRQKFSNYPRLTYVACNLRFLDSLQSIKETIDEKKVRINEVNIYAGSYLPDWRPDVDFRKVYSAIPELGGGVHLDLIHEIDYVYWLFGIPKSIISRLSSKSSLDIRSVDSASYLLEYEKFNVNISLNYFRKDSKRTAEFVFEDETIELDLRRNCVTNAKDEILFEGKVNIADTYTLQLAYFIGLVKDKKTISQNPLNDGIEVLKICLNE